MAIPLAMSQILKLPNKAMLSTIWLNVRIKKTDQLKTKSTKGETMNNETKTTSNHWTQELKTENKKLQTALSELEDSISFIISSRYQKLNQYIKPAGNDSYDLGYRAALDEISLRIGEARSLIHSDILNSDTFFNQQR